MDVSAWFGSNQVLDRVSLTMPPATVTALIGPSGCGKSTFLRILNRMHESNPAAAMAGEVRLDGTDVYTPQARITDVRKRIGMVFQKPNPFPAMSIAENVTAGLKVTGTRASRREKQELVERCLIRGGCGTRSRTASASPAGRCPVVSSSGCASPVRWRSSRTCCSWTSPARPSTRRRPAAWRRRSRCCATRSPS
ncbi:hypothetical protein GCM10025868_19550 [Angustibacter aerolatus]|uniref:ABC transporter domain-containing protein n=1 Tax=Angustibacter aerolatus TaxID=1162965 RepID=A0ABQ6JHL2_9ACTN|nr:hypothetical protein GCM10025868_19550 [Angustibacter aerolatus]